MVRVILDEYSAFRNADFTAIVTETGVKEFGEEGIPKCYLEFDDGGAPITYPLIIKGKPVIERDETGAPKKERNVKDFGVGAFKKEAFAFGLKTFVDDDPDSYEFGTIPDIVGMETTWKAVKGKERIDADGSKKEGYTNFTLVSVKKPGATTSLTPAAKDKANHAKPNEPALKPGELDPAIIAAWKDNLTIILAVPSTAGEIQKAINDMIKTATPDQKAILTKMSGIRPAALKALEAEKFLSKDADLKYSLVEMV